MSAPVLICSLGNCCGAGGCAAALAQAIARLQTDQSRICVGPAQSGINANVHTDPPAGTTVPAERVGLLPPRPDSTVTYCWPLYVYVIGGALMLDPVLNCHSCLPVS